jgi:serine phosphatase RsbU (regulator of sigma subunit)
MVAAVFEELGRFCRGMPYEDDVTLVVIKIE